MRVHRRSYHDTIVDEYPGDGLWPLRGVAETSTFSMDLALKCVVIRQMCVWDVAPFKKRWDDIPCSLKVVGECLKIAKLSEFEVRAYCFERRRTGDTASSTSETTGAILFAGSTTVAARDPLKLQHTNSPGSGTYSIYAPRLQMEFPRYCLCRYVVYLETM